MMTTRKLRNRIAAATGAIPLASFSTFLWLFFAYFSSHPEKPQPELGMVHRLSNHGSYVYISNAESTGMTLLVFAFAIGLALTIAIAPKEFSLPPPETPRWLLYVSASAKTDSPSIDTIAIWLASLLLCFAFIWLAGPTLVAFVTSQGIVLSMPG